ncbi:MAG: dihydrodipicolinate synthase family protein [Ramlibacter sp.]
MWETAPFELTAGRSGLATLRAGGVFPAHPLALDRDRQFDSRRQRALTRYYLDAGADGIAVGVHSTQFAIRERGLYETVLRCASETVRAHGAPRTALIAGVMGKTPQALGEAQTALGLGYDAALLGLGAFRGAGEDEIIRHCRQVGECIPLVGFYLQPAVGGIRLSSAFWRKFCELESVVAIKIAAFNRYATLDVLRGLVDARAEKRVTLLTGNDDSILVDLLTDFRLPRDGEVVELRFQGGLLGHWSVGTRRAVELMARVRSLASQPVPREMLSLAASITDVNAALFDANNAFHGAIPGIHEVLRRQGLLQGTWCLDPEEGLGEGQLEEIDRVLAAYPALTDDAFIAANLHRWLV